MMPLVLNVKKGDTIKIGDDIDIRVTKKPGASMIAVTVKAPQDLKITRIQECEETGEKKIRVRQ